MSTTLVMAWGGVLNTPLSEAEVLDKMKKALSQGPWVAISLEKVVGITFPAHIARVIENPDDGDRQLPPRPFQVESGPGA